MTRFFYSGKSVVTAIMLFRTMIVVAIVIMVMMRVGVRCRGREWIGKILPTRRAGSHFIISQQTLIDLRTQNSFIQV